MVLTNGAGNFPRLAIAELALLLIEPGLSWDPSAMINLRASARRAPNLSMSVVWLHLDLPLGRWPSLLIWNLLCSVRWALEGRFVFFGSKIVHVL